MTGRTRLIVAGVAAFLVCVLFFVFFIRPRQSNLSKVNQDIEAAEAENAQLRITLDRLQGLRAQSAELEATLEEIRGFVPEEDELPNFIFQVQEAANLAGVGFHQVTPELPKTPPEGAPLAEIRTTITAQGGYFSLQDFIRRLYALDRALRIDTLTLGPAEEAETQTTTTTTTTGTPEAADGDLTLTVTARIFFELPEGATGAAPTTPTTGATPAPTTTTPAPAATPPPATPAPAPSP